MSPSVAEIEGRARRVVLRAARSGHWPSGVRLSADGRLTRTALLWALVRGHIERTGPLSYHATPAGLAWAKQEAA